MTNKTRVWRCNWRKLIVAPTHNQVWHYIWDVAMSKIIPDKKSQIDSNGEFKSEYKNYDHDYDDSGNRYKCKTYTICKHALNTMGHTRGRQIALGRALKYNTHPIRTRNYSDPGMGPYSGWHKGSKPKGERVDKLLAIAGFNSFSHATFVWAGAGRRLSPVMKPEPLKKYSKKDLIKICEDAIDRNLGDICNGDSTPEQIYDKAYTLSLDALADAGCTMNRAFKIATQVVINYQ